MTGGEVDKLNVIERRIDVMQTKQEFVLADIAEMKDSQLRIEAKIDQLSDRMWETRVQNGVIAAVIAGLVQVAGFFGLHRG